MRPEKLYLQDMIEACEAIEGFLEQLDETTFHSSALYQSAILQKLTVIGEAASRLSKEFCHQHPTIEWEDIIGFRNIAVHAYFTINWQIVWATANDDVPELKQHLNEIIKLI